MRSHAIVTRWAAPCNMLCHPRLALVRHREHLYSFTELIGHLPVMEIGLSDDTSLVAQEIWDRLAHTAPEAAEHAVRLSEARDFEVLDLYACAAFGSA